jgi:hypothetical protein
MSDPWDGFVHYLEATCEREAAHELDQPPMTPRQVYRAMLTLGRRTR